MNLNELTAEQQKNPARIQTRVAKVLENRVGSALGVVEGTVSARGTDQFIVELPDIKNIEEARQLLKSTAKIEVYHAKNVQTAIRQKRYSKYDETTENGGPVVRFVRSADSSKVLTPGDPEYADMIKGWDLILSGSEVKDAVAQVTNGGKYQPHFNFSDVKAARWSFWPRQNGGLVAQIFSTGREYCIRDGWSCSQYGSHQKRRNIAR